MNAEDEGGYDKERFPDLKGEAFDCCICCLVVKQPKECTSCGSMFCQNCIDSWLQKRKECPNRCAVTKDSIKPIGRALLRIYNDLDIRCKYFEKCKKTLKTVDIEAHELVCNLPKCVNFEICGHNVNADNKTSKVCDPTCLLLSKIREADGDWTKVHQEIKHFMKNYSSPTTAQAGPGITKAITASTSVFKWDTVNIGSNIDVSSDRTKVFLREGPYMFRTCIGDTPLNGGIHYWEIHADDKTENELKIGVSTKKDFNYNSAFCDYEFGFSYYGLGQLRHNSNANGPPYGKRFKKEGVLGVLLDMNKGILSFGLNGECFGVAYNDEKLKRGPIFPAVSLLHCAGCTLVSGVKPPPQFLQ